MAENMARTLQSTAAGIKHDVTTRDQFVARITVAIDLFLPALNDSIRNGAAKNRNPES